MATAYLLCRGKVEQRDNSPLIPDTSISPCRTLVPFKLPPWCWTLEGLSLSRSVHVQVFQRNCLGLQQFLPPTQSPLVFVARICGDLFSWHWNLGLEGLLWGWDSLPLRYPSRVFIHHTWVRDQAIPCLCPSYQSQWMWFNSVVVRLPFSSISGGSECWLFYILVVILMWLCKGASHVCLHCHLDWNSTYISVFMYLSLLSFFLDETD